MGAERPSEVRADGVPVRRLSGEARLCAAIIEDTISVLHYQPDTIQARRDRSWICGDRAYITFEHACDILGLDAIAVRARFVGISKFAGDADVTPLPIRAQNSRLRRRSERCGQPKGAIRPAVRAPRASP